MSTEYKSVRVPVETYARAVAIQGRLSSSSVDVLPQSMQGASKTHRSTLLPLGSVIEAGLLALEREQAAEAFGAAMVTLYDRLVVEKNPVVKDLEKLMVLHHVLAGVAEEALAEPPEEIPATKPKKQKRGTNG